MITAQQTIRAFTSKLAPIKIAAASYKKWNSQVDFIDDLDDYLVNGVVISTPYLFGMAKLIDVSGIENPKSEYRNPKPEPAWFVRMAVGRLDVLLGHLPCFYPKICFCRRNDGRLRVYDTARLMKLAMKASK